MRKKSIFFLILILTFVFCGCSNNLSPFDEQQTDTITPRTFKVYVCGAVEHEGYVEVKEGADFVAVLDMVEVLPQTVYPSEPHTLIKDDEVLILQYYDGNESRDCININGGYVTARLPIEGIDADVIDRIADYCELHGKITDRDLLQEILGEDYFDNYYKFFVDVKDYEKVS